MRIAFFTYWGAIGARVLEYLVENTQNEMVAVVTRPGAPGDAIKEFVFKHYLPLYQPLGNVNDPEFGQVLKRLEPDLFISMYFGRLFSPDMLAIPKQGCVNMHPSLLPKYRGQGPSTWPIINGESETGQTVHWLNEGIDTGDIIAQRAIPIALDDTGATLSAKLLEVGVELFVDTWPLIESGRAPRIAQDNEQATYSVAPRREHARIDWSRSAEHVSRVVRAFAPPGRGAWSEIGGNVLIVKRARVLAEPLPGQGWRPGQIVAVTGEGVAVQTGEGQLLLTDAQVGQQGPDLASYLGQVAGEIQILLG